MRLRNHPKGAAMQEQWKPVAGYEGSYEVSNLGRVKSLARKKLNRGIPTLYREIILKPSCSKKWGYRNIGLYLDGRCVRKKIARLVAEHFIPNPNGFRYTDHINGQKTDDRSENLEWVTGAENLRRAYALGLHKPTPRKIPDDKVFQVKMLVDQGMSIRQASSAVGVKYSSVCTRLRLL